MSQEFTAEDLAGEEWRVCVRDARYSVSSIGRMRGPRGLMRPNLCRFTGYMKVTLGRGKKTTVHALLAEAFIGPRPEGSVVRHLDGTRTRNRRENIAYGSPSENAQDMVRHGRSNRGQRSPFVKLSDQQVLEIYLSKEHTVDVAAHFGVSRGMVSLIRSGKNWKHLTSGIAPGLSLDERQKRGVEAPACKLTELDVLAIWANRGFCTTYSLAETFGVTQAQVSSIHTGRSWRHLTGAVFVRQRFYKTSRAA